VLVISTTRSSRVSTAYKAGWRTIRAILEASRRSCLQNLNTKEKRQDFVYNQIFANISNMALQNTKQTNKYGARAKIHQTNKYESRYLICLFVAESGMLVCSAASLVGMRQYVDAQHLRDLWMDLSAGLNHSCSLAAKWAMFHLLLKTR
jgi:hypothetical protein